MVVIEYRPYEKIVVHEIKKLDPSIFFPWIAGQVEAQKAGGIANVNWIDGIAFVNSEFPLTPQIIEEVLKGIVHYGVVTFTETSYQQEKKVSAGTRDHVVRLNKAEENAVFVALVEFLKSFKP